jgi:hypothetical protein
MGDSGGSGGHLPSFELLNFAEAGVERISAATVFTAGKTEQAGQKQHVEILRL